MRIRLDDNLWRRALRLTRKVSKTQGILPSSYLLQTDDIRVGVDRAEGAFGIVSDGEYQGNTVAIKRIKICKGGSGKDFKVSYLGPSSRIIVV